MPPLDEVLAMLWGIVPALVSAAIVMAAVEWIGGSKQGPAASGLAMFVGVILGLWMLSAAPLLSKSDPWPSFAALHAALTATGGESAWNRLPWAVLAALCAERIARNVDTHTSDGW